MAYGKPIVATRITGTNELIKPDFNGILVEPKSPGKLAEAVIKILSEKDYADRLGKNGELFSRNFSWEKAVSEYANIYRELRSMRMPVD